MQGGWENDETVEEAAAREAVEEAGVRGELMVKYIFLSFICSNLYFLSFFHIITSNFFEYFLFIY